MKTKSKITTNRIPQPAPGQDRNPTPRAMVGRPKIPTADRRISVPLFLAPKTLAMIDDASAKTAMSRGRVVDAAMALMVEYKNTIDARKKR